MQLINKPFKTSNIMQTTTYIITRCLNNYFSAGDTVLETKATEHKNGTITITVILDLSGFTKPRAHANTIQKFSPLLKDPAILKSKVNRKGHLILDINPKSFSELELYHFWFY